MRIDIMNTYGTGRGPAPFDLILHHRWCPALRTWHFMALDTTSTVIDPGCIIRTIKTPRSSHFGGRRGNFQQGSLDHSKLLNVHPNWFNAVFYFVVIVGNSGHLEVRRYAARIWGKQWMPFAVPRSMCQVICVDTCLSGVEELHNTTGWHM